MLGRTRKRMTIVLWLGLLFGLVSFTVVRIYFLLTDDFRLAHLAYEVPDSPEQKIPFSSNPHLLDALLQKEPYTYIGKGAQSYVFLSPDQQHVLKCFKFKHLRPAHWSSILSFTSLFKEFREEAEARRQKKLSRLFKGYRLAYETIPEESGLLFLQLSPSHQRQLIIIKDKLGFSRELDLGEVCFIIQKKGETLASTLNRLLAASQVEEAEKRIEQILSLYHKEHALGVYDSDRNLLNNVGFAGDALLHLDVGSLEQKTLLQDSEAELAIAREQIIHWLKVHHPHVTFNNANTK